MATLIVRQAAAADIPEITAIDELCFSVPWSRESFVQEITANDMALYVVAEVEGRVAGYAGLWLIVDEGHITNVAVHPGFRRKSIAKALVQVLIEETERRGALRFTLEVRPSNHAAIALYESFGFVGAGVRPGYYEDNNEDAMIMWRE